MQLIGPDIKQLPTLFVILGLLCANGPLAAFAGNDAQGLDQAAADPLNATYLIEDVVIRLEKVIQRWLTIGHEVRSIKLSDEPSAIWLVGGSPAMKAILSAYRRALPDGKPYQPVFAVLSGKFVAPPTAGFGADYEAAFLATHLVRIAPAEDCSTIHQGPNSKTSILQKLSFDISSFDEKGFVGQLGGKRTLSYETLHKGVLNAHTNLDPLNWGLPHRRLSFCCSITTDSRQPARVARSDRHNLEVAANPLQQ